MHVALQRTELHVKSMTRLAAITLTLAVMACSDASEPNEVFTTAEGRWENASYVSYTFTAERSCFCTEEGRGPVRISVSNGTVASVVMISTGAQVDPAIWFTVDGLFDLIREQLTTLPRRLDVQYHAIIGYPTRVSYGTPENDGGGTILVRDLTRD